MKDASRRPQLPGFMAFPMHFVPGQMHGFVAARLLDQVFAEQRKDGELDFMEGRSVRIRVLDAGIDVGLALDGGTFASVAADRETDLVVEGLLYDYLLLVTGREDPDTLFFQRFIRLSGDTALGVHLKNFIAGVDMDSLPLAGIIRPGLDQGLRLYERVLS